jgi:hypothetical protein
LAEYLIRLEDQIRRDHGDLALAKMQGGMPI